MNGDIGREGVGIAKEAIERDGKGECCDVSRKRPSEGCDLRRGKEKFEVKSPTQEDLGGHGGRWFEEREWEELRKDPCNYKIVIVTEVGTPTPKIQIVSGEEILDAMVQEGIPLDELDEMVNRAREITPRGTVSVKVTPPWSVVIQKLT